MARPAPVQGTTVNMAVATPAPSLSSVAAGNTLILTVFNATQTSGQAASAVSGAGATWTMQATKAGTVGVMDIWVGVNASAGTAAPIITPLGVSPSMGCRMEEWSLVAQSLTLESSASNSGTSTSPSLAMTPVNIGDVLYVASDAAVETANPASPWTTVVGPTTIGTQKNGLAYYVALSVSTQTASWTTASAAWTTLGVILRPSDPTGYQIQNAVGAQNNAGVLSAEATPDYVDSIISAAALGGTGVEAGCAVTPNTGTDLKFQVGVGVAVFSGTRTAFTAVSAQTITAADATNPRRDLVYLKSAGTVVYVAGVANATPCPPTLPLNCVALAFIDVPANATQLDTTTSTAQAHVIDKRVMIACVPGTLLARVQYSAATNTSYSTSSTSFVNLDATNLTVTFTAPPSGAVLFLLNALIGPGSSSLEWAVASSTFSSGAGQPPGGGHRVGYNGGQYRQTALILVTGLTAGTSYTFTWQQKVDSGTAATTYAGGSNTGQDVGPAVMVAMAA